MTHCFVKSLIKFNVLFIDRIIAWNQKIENCMNEVENSLATGIIYVFGIFGADGTAKDVDNVKATFKSLNFAVYRVRDPTSDQIVEFVEAAAKYNYRMAYKFVAFYFAGHGGRDEFGNAYIKGLEMPDFRAEKVLIEEAIVDPMKQIRSNITRIFFFDCCQTQSTSTRSSFHVDSYADFTAKTPQPSPNQVIAYATSIGQKSFGDLKNGGIWTYHLCNNLMTELSLVNVLAKTYDDVKKERSNFQLPMTVASIGKVSLQKDCEFEGIN